MPKMPNENFLKTTLYHEKNVNNGDYCKDGNHNFATVHGDRPNYLTTWAHCFIQVCFQQWSKVFHLALMVALLISSLRSASDTDHWLHFCRLRYHSFHQSCWSGALCHPSGWNCSLLWHSFLATGQTNGLHLCARAGCLRYINKGVCE